MATEQQQPADNSAADSTPAVVSTPAEQPTTIQNAKRPATPLPDHIQHALQLRAQEREISAELSKTNWGEKLDVFTRKAVAHWGMRHGIDVAQEIDILGNRIYLNAKFYLRGLAHLVEAGKVDYVDVDHVEDDPRLAAFPKERQRRLELRIQYHLPDTAVSACIARIKLKNVPIEFTGAQWCGGRGMKRVKGRNGSPDYEVQKDPIGEDRPVETSETRALRRCLRLMVTHIPSEAAKRDAALDDAATELEGVIESARSRAKADISRAARLPRPLAQAAEGDPYSNENITTVRPALTEGAPPAADTSTASSEAEFQDDTDLVSE
jgi:hypothetical protein